MDEKKKGGFSLSWCQAFSFGTKGSWESSFDLLSSSSSEQNFAKYSPRLNPYLYIRDERRILDPLLLNESDHKVEPTKENEETGVNIWGYYMYVSLKETYI